jgi:hypothetical protein
MKKKTAKFDPIRVQKTAARKAHFENGGTISGWRGIAMCLDESTSKARKNKRSCRDWKRSRVIEE